MDRPEVTVTTFSTRIPHWKTLFPSQALPASLFSSLRGICSTPYQHAAQASRSRTKAEGPAADEPSGGGAAVASAVAGAQHAPSPAGQALPRPHLQHHVPDFVVPSTSMPHCPPGAEPKPSGRPRMNLPVAVLQWLPLLQVRSTLAFQEWEAARAAQAQEQ